MKRNYFICPGVKKHIFKTEGEYLYHIKNCYHVSIVKEVFYCKYFDDHIFRSEKAKKHHEIYCKYRFKQVTDEKKGKCKNKYYKDSNHSRFFKNVIQYSKKSRKKLDKAKINYAKTVNLKDEFKDLFNFLEKKKKNLLLDEKFFFYMNFYFREDSYNFRIYFIKQNDNFDFKNLELDFKDTGNNSQTFKKYLKVENYLGEILLMLDDSYRVKTEDIFLRKNEYTYFSGNKNGSYYLLHVIKNKFSFKLFYVSNKFQKYFDFNKKKFDLKIDIENKKKLIEKIEKENEMIGNEITIVEGHRSYFKRQKKFIDKLKKENNTLLLNKNTLLKRINNKDVLIKNIIKGSIETFREKNLTLLLKLIKEKNKKNNEIKDNIITLKKNNESLEKKLETKKKRLFLIDNNLTENSLLETQMKNQFEKDFQSYNNIKSQEIEKKRKIESISRKTNRKNSQKNTHNNSKCIICIKNIRRIINFPCWCFNLCVNCHIFQLKFNYHRCIRCKEEISKFFFLNYGN